MIHPRRRPLPAAAPLLLLLLLCAAAGVGGVRAQEPKPAGQDEVINVTTDLIQLGVAVLDKDGRFVRGLTRDQFQLEVDGRPQPIHFFEVVSAQAARATPAPARAGGAPARAPARPPAPAPGRSVIFFVDDVHLGPDSTVRARRLILKFVEEEMRPDDQVLIVTTTSQLGFLQQPSGDKVMLRRAASKLLTRVSADLFERESPPMSKHEALAVDRGDRDALDYFIAEVLRLQLAQHPETAESLVRERARTIIGNANRMAAQSLAALEQIARSAAGMPGRKLTFFVSDGFFLDLTGSNASDRLRRIADLASRSGVVVYSIDARGLSAGNYDPSLDGRSDPAGRLPRVNMSATRASQDVLHKVAEDTGGRALVNNNDLSAAVRKGLEETAEHYLVAWQRGEGDAAPDKFRRVKLTIRDRPELRVLTQSGYLTTAAAEERAGDAGGQKPAAKTEPARGPLESALAALAVGRGLDVELSLSHVNTADKESTVLVNLAVHAAGGGPVEALLAVYDETGKLIERGRSEKSPAAASAPTHFAHRLGVAPGLYQVRAAARDRATGETGSARRWVEVPDVARGDFALSGLLVTEAAAGEGAGAAGSGHARGNGTPAGRRFERTSSLRVVLFVYNAGRPRNGPPVVSVKLEVKPAAAPDTPALQTDWKKVPVAGGGDPRRLPYAAEIKLDTLAPGRYLLEVTAVDDSNKKTALESFGFSVR